MSLLRLVQISRSHLPAAVCLARFSSAAPEIESQRINSNVTLRYEKPRVGVNTIDKRKPLVLLFGWLMSKPKHLNKYGNLYISEGFDVLTIQVRPTQVLMPKISQALADDILRYLEDNFLDTRPLLVHGFSVGAYLFGEVLVKMHQNPERYNGIMNRICGQVFDSPADLEGIPEGFSRVLSQNPIVQKTLQAILHFYLVMFKSSVTKHYLASSKVFRANDLRLPTLLLFSMTDPVGRADKILQVSDQWKNKQIPVYRRSWENSPHVNHFHKHPDEYVEAILMFLDNIGLMQPELEAEKYGLGEDEEKESQVQ